VCGDGIIEGDEQCDDAVLNLGAPGGCLSDCSYAPYCGDGRVDPGELCDDGANVTQYGPVNCAPGCVIPHHCGDGVTDAADGESCDDGSSACRKCHLRI
jgi:cysteine-rich repeat protein